MDFQKLQAAQQPAPTGAVPVMGARNFGDDAPIGGGCLNFSYAISAMLHPANIYRSFRSQSGFEQFFVVVDLILHLAVWITAIIMEIWIFGQEHRGARKYEEIGSAAFWTLLLAFGGVLITQLANWMAAGNAVIGSAYPTTIAMITGGGVASAAFSAITYVLAMQDGEYASTHDATKHFHNAYDKDDKLCTTRQLLLWLIALKLIAVATVKANAAYRTP